MKDDSRSQKKFVFVSSFISLHGKTTRKENTSNREMRADIGHGWRRCLINQWLMSSVRVQIKFIVIAAIVFFVRAHKQKYAFEHFNLAVIKLLNVCCLSGSMRKAGESRGLLHKNRIKTSRITKKRGLTYSNKCILAKSCTFAKPGYEGTTMSSQV